MSNGWAAADAFYRPRYAPWAIMVPASMAVVTACTGIGAENERISKQLTIHRHHFDPPLITVPANRGFDLVVSANDMAALTITSPAIGVETIRVLPLRAAE